MTKNTSFKNAMSLNKLLKHDYKTKGAKLWDQFKFKIDTYV